MKIGVFGTGIVGQTLAGKLAELGHDVVIGTRDPKVTLARTEKDAMGFGPFRDWHATHDKVKLVTLGETAKHGELFFNVLNGQGAVEGLRAAGEDALAGKVLVDVTNPLDFSKGFPPSLLVCNTDSLGEQLQRAFPKARVVKSLNTLNCNLMVHPGNLAEETDVFVSGNDPVAKADTVELLKSFGWKRIHDLGDITSARGTEMWLPMWLRLMGSLKTADFNVRIVTR